MPVRLISSVRGIGVAVSVSTSTSARSCLIRSLCCTPKRCSSSTTSSPRSLNFDVVRQQPVRADDDVDLARRARRRDHRRPAPWREEPRQHLDPHRVAGEALAERLAVLAARAAWSGTRTATCLPSCTALNAARIATSVLPKPTSPQTRRSIGIGRSMSAFTSSMALSLVGRLLVRERLLDLALPRRVGRERVARRARAAAGRARRAPAAISRTARAHPRLGLLPVGAAHLRAASASRRRCTGGRRRSGRTAT